MKNNDFLRGLRAGLPICLGYLSVAFAFGIFAVGSGLDIWQALLISMTNVTSAGQLAGVPLIVSGASLAEMASAQFVINLRYSLMSVSLSQKFDGSVSLFDRFILAFVNTDEVFAVASGNAGTVGRAYMYGLILTPYFGWSLGTLAGAVAGNILPSFVVSALGIAIYGMFIAICVPVMRDRKSVTGAVILSAAVACAFRFIPALSSVPNGFVIIICAVPAALIFALFCPVPCESESRI